MKCSGRRTKRALFSLLAVPAMTLATGCPAQDPDAGPQAREPRIMVAEETPCTVTEPCPEAAAAVEAIGLDDPRLEQARVIDARERSAFEGWHFPGAMLMTYDFLEPPAPEDIARLALSDAPLVVVYGDGDDPDSGEEMARDLGSRGLGSVYFIEGGAEALRSLAETASKN